MIGHHHLGTERRVDDPIINLHRVIYDALDVKVLSLHPRNVHCCPNHILEQNSTVFQDRTDLRSHRVPVSHIYETVIYDAPSGFVILIRQAVHFGPVPSVGVHYELNFKSGPEVRLKLFQLYVHSAGGLAGRPWGFHFEVPFFSGSGGWHVQDSIF